MSEVKDVPESSAGESAEAVQQPQGSVEELQKQNEGLLKDLQEERLQRQSAQQQAKIYEQLMAQQQQPAPVREDYEPDDLATKGDLKRVIQEEMQRFQAQSQSTLARSQEDILRSRYDDYDKVMGYFGDVSKQYPDLNLNLLKSHPQGLEIAYRLGKSHPEAQKLLKEKATQEVLAKAQANVNKPSTNVSGESEKTYADYSNPENIRKKLQELGIS